VAQNYWHSNPVSTHHILPGLHLAFHSTIVPIHTDVLTIR